MVTWLMRRAIGAFERKWNYDARYLYDILEASPRAAQLFWGVASLGQYRRDIPIEAWSAAGIMAGPRRHQQRLANNRVGFSRLPGKHGRGNTGAAADDPSGEEAPTSATAEQTDVTESTQCIVAERVLEGEPRARQPSRSSPRNHGQVRTVAFNVSAGRRSRRKVMAKMRAVQVTSPRGPLELVEREIPQPGPGAVRIKVQACGICHSDSLVKEGHWPGVQYPRVPGHEVTGVIDAVAPDVSAWKKGQRVGVGWHGGHCGSCESCRRGDFVTCVNLQIPGFTFDGGYQEYMVAPATSLASVPDELSATEAGPLMCAGVTTYNSLRNSGARPGDLVAILGLGGLGHLGVQFAAKMGFRTAAIARGQDKAPLAKQLGARHYIDSQAQDPAAELAKLGGARVILATVTSSKAMAATLGGLGINGKLVVLGADPEPLVVPGLLLLSKRASVAGWPSGSSSDSQDTMNFCALSGVRSLNETYPLERAAEGYERMMSGKARFRVVLATS
jgi:D-arabinose 1-dehydrogenase-like Zn-dependent alcohol dehydrogenase